MFIPSAYRVRTYYFVGFGSTRQTAENLSVHSSLNGFLVWQALAATASRDSGTNGHAATPNRKGLVQGLKRSTWALEYHTLILFS